MIQIQRCCCVTLLYVAIDLDAAYIDHRASWVAPAVKEKITVGVLRNWNEIYSSVMVLRNVSTSRNFP